MRKEAINTFGEGLIMDLHPLTTPSNVLTNCLNGTIITYNGNEFVLQNDMGNGEVHTAYLDKGYVPVGMKEHGGIIYVAAHNPVTGKSQIGSFPSPQQLYEGEDLNVTPIRFDFSKFITMKGSVPYIELEYYKERLFQTENTGEVKIFHPGDRFVITSTTIDTAIKEAINKGVVKLRLGVINSSGNIDYIDEKNLKIYKNGLWIYENTDTPMLDVIKSKELVQVFSAKSSGALILVIELKTFDTFNLIRKYSCNDESKVISVEFSGETTGVYEGTSKKNPAEIGILEETDYAVKSTIVKSGKTGKQTYKILPVCPYGALERMAKIGTIDFDAIRTNSEVLGEWRFYVTDTYLKIGWGYDYYNLNEDSNITKIEFTFIDINDSAEAKSAATLKGDYVYTISKEYYNGSFEEIIPFGDSTIRKSWIYIVRIDRYVGDTKKTVGYELVYTGSYFNDSFEETPDFNKLPSGSARQKVLLGTKNEVNTSVRNGNITTAIKVHDSQTFVDKDVVSPLDYIKEVPSDAKPNYRYNTRKTGVYDVIIRPAADFDFDDRTYAGKPDQSVINNFFGSTPTATFGKPDNSNIAFSSSSTLTSEIGANQLFEKTENFAWDNSKKELKGRIYTSRNIIAANGPVKSTSAEIEKLMPVYSPSLDTSELNKLFTFKETDDVLYCVTGSRGHLAYNSRVLRDAHTKGDFRGPDGGAGVNEEGLRACLASMGNGTIGIFGGHDCDAASLRFNDTQYTNAAWFRKDQEIDDEDNYLIATWKDKDGNHWPINLASRKTENANVQVESTLIRVEKMIKCFLSQMLVVKKGNKSFSFVGPNNLEFVYHTAFNTSCDVNVPINNAGRDIDVNFFLGESKESIESHMAKWVAAISGLKNFLPIFKVHMPTSAKATIEYGDNIKFDTDSNILNCYTSAYSYYTTSGGSQFTDEERGKIFIGKPASPFSANSDGSINLAVNSDGTYQINQASDSNMVSWRNEPISLGYRINDRFINMYEIEGRSGEIPAGYFNDVRIHNISTVLATWTDGKDHSGSAPDMAINIGFGPKSIFRY